MRSEMMLTTISSETRPPAAMMSLACRPTGVPAATAARSISPVESWTMPYRSTSRCAWVPLPDPGGPRRISLIGVRPPAVGERNSPVVWVLTAPRALAAAAPQFRLPDQPLILMGEQIALNLRHGVHGDTDHDQKRCTTKVEGHRSVGNQNFGDQADDRKINRAEHRDTR